MSELLLGCGHQRKKLAGIPGDALEWKDLITLDYNGDCDPDINCDLRVSRWCSSYYKDTAKRFISKFGYFIPDSFDEVHAYEVLEHLGHQGDVSSFFNTFDNLWRILSDGAFLFATCPSRHSPWAWGDPGHTRIISQESLTFLSQEEYQKQCGKTPMSDYRWVYKSDFKIIDSQDDGMTHRFVLQAVKPSRTYINK